MLQIKYIHFTCDHDQLQDRLTELGDQGWRLHTCEPILPVGPNGSGTLLAFVVMDMQMYAEEEVTTDDADRGAIQMKS